MGHFQMAPAGLALLLFLTLCASVTHGTLVCATRESALDLVAGAINSASGVRFLVGRLVPKALTNRAALDALLSQEMHVLVDAPLDAVQSESGTVHIARHDDDVRQLTMPLAWLSAPLAVSADVPTADCSALAAGIADTPPPPEVLSVLSALVEYTTLLAGDRACDVNEVPVQSSPGVFACACADGRVCMASASVVDLLQQWVQGLLIATIVLAMLAAMVATALLIARASPSPLAAGPAASEDMLELMDR